MMPVIPPALPPMITASSSGNSSMPSGALDLITVILLTLNFFMFSLIRSMPLSKRSIAYTCPLGAAKAASIEIEPVPAPTSRTMLSSSMRASFITALRISHFVIGTSPRINSSSGIPKKCLILVPPLQSDQILLAQLTPLA